MAAVYNSQLDAFELYWDHIHKPVPAPKPLLGPALPALGHAVAGAIGASISNALTYPINLVVTRLQVQRQLRRQRSTQNDGASTQSLPEAARSIYCREGLDGLYAGLPQDTLKTIADAFLFFLAYDGLRRSRLRARGGRRALPAHEELAVGFAAGAFAKLATTPAGNIVARLQTASLQPEASAPDEPDEQDEPAPPDTARRQAPRATAAQIAARIHAADGLRGFWAGYAAALLLTLNPALTFLLFEALKRALLPRARRARPRPAATFALAAVSKALASCVTFPAAVAKARMQCAPATPPPLESKASSELQGQEKKRNAPRRSVLGTIRAIVAQDGVLALYEGLEGEVLKGFLGHGTTMLIKGAAHRIVLQFYFTILRTLRRFPDPKELAGDAEMLVKKAAYGVSGGSREAQAARDTDNGASTAKSPVSIAIMETTEHTTEAAGDVATKGAAMVSGALQEAGEITDLLADYLGESSGLDGMVNDSTDNGQNGDL